MTLGRWTLCAATVLVLAAGCGRRETKEKETEAAAPPPTPGQVVLSPASVQSAGIVVGVAGPATIDVTLQLPGEVEPDSSRVLTVRPRFPGVVHSLSKPVGALVVRGETIARIQSNESLTDYTVTSSMGGSVVARGAAVGEVVSPDTPLYTIVDLSDVWVEFAVYPHQLGSVRQGQEVLIRTQSEPGPTASGRIAYVGPILSEATQVSQARVVLPNPGRRWQPGLFVNVTVITDRVQARVAVPDEAIVRTNEGPVVFITDGRSFLERRVETGRSDGRTTEILSGLGPGTKIAAKNAFVLRAELEKSQFEEE